MFNFFDQHKWYRVLLVAISSPLLLNLIPIAEASIFHTPQQKFWGIVQYTVIATIIAFQRKAVRDGFVRAALIFPLIIVLFSLGSAGSHARRQRQREWFDD